MCCVWCHEWNGSKKGKGRKKIFCLLASWDVKNEVDLETMVTSWCHLKELKWVGKELKGFQKSDSKEY